MIQLANKIIEVTQTNSRIVHNPLPVDDPQKRCPDITKAKEILDWEPNYSLSDGLKPTISWFKKIL